jgi:hypothetical protein
VQNVRVQNIEVHPSSSLSETLKQMNYLESLSLNNPRLIKLVFEKFNSRCTGCVPGKIWKFMKDNFYYALDDPYDEKITAPYILLDTKKGDCDDFSLFAKTCLDMLGGWYTNYMLLGKNRNEYTHIICFAHRGKNILGYIDPVFIDGASDTFNVIHPKYKFNKII